MAHEGKGVGAQLVKGAGGAVVLGGPSGGVQRQVQGHGVHGGQQSGEQCHAVGPGLRTVDPALLDGGSVAGVGLVGVDGDHRLGEVLLELAQGAAGCFVDDLVLGGDGDLGG